MANLNETREKQIARWEKSGWLVPGCPGCQPVYDDPRKPAQSQQGPSHKPSNHCESGKRPHCSCDRCW